MRRFAATCSVLVSLAAGAAVSETAGAPPSPAPTTAVVSDVIDGDTIKLTNGFRVRLLQIDAPEPGSGECFSRASGRELRRLLPSGSRVTLEADPPLDLVDRYSRLLRYVHHRGVNLNVELVRRGAATVWFYRGERGRYATALLEAARSSRAAGRGLWGACARAVWNPSAAAETGSSQSPAARPRTIARGRCDASYPTVCIPPAPPDLDCADVPHRDFAVRPPDPHRFDGEGDGLGCEG